MQKAPASDDRSIWGRRFFFLGLNVGALAAVFGLLHIVSVAIDKVRSGKGFETYRTVWLVDFSYAGMLVLLAAVFVALLVGSVLWWREERLWRSFERKYGARDADT